MKPSGIRLLTNFADQDLVAEILRSVTMKTVVFGRAVLRAPWGLHVDLPGKAVFHIVLQGRCWLSVDGTVPTHLTEGDIALFPRADAHDMNDHPATPRRPITELLIKHPMTPDRRFCYGGRGPLTTLLCGAFELDDPALNLLGCCYPLSLTFGGRRNGSAQLRTLTQCIEAELKVFRPGEQAMVTRMAEVLLLRAVRD